MLYFHGVGTNPVQRQKIEFPLLRREGQTDLEEQCLLRRWGNGMKCPVKGPAYQSMHASSRVTSGREGYMSHKEVGGSGGRVSEVLFGFFLVAQ